MTLEDRINRLAKPLKLGLLAMPAAGATLVTAKLPAGLVSEKSQELARIAKTYGQYGVQPLLYAVAIGSGWKSNFNWAVGSAVAGWVYKMGTWAVTPGANFEHYFQQGLKTAAIAGGLALSGKLFNYLAKHI